MSSISELLKHQGGAIKIIPDQKSVEGQQDSSNLIEKYTNQIVKLPESNPNDVITEAWKTIGNTLGKYPQVRTDPGVGLSIVNKLLGTDYSSNSATPEIKLPKWVTAEDEAILTNVTKTLGGVLNNIAGRTKKTNYTILINALNAANSGTNRLGGSGILGAVTGGLLSAGANGAASSEFEKSRNSPALPEDRANEKISAVITEEESALGQKSGILGQIGLNRLGIVDKTGLIDAVNVLSSDLTGEDGIQSQPLTSSAKKKYAGDKSTITEYLNELSNKGLLTGFKSYSGFEMGSDHDWVIQIFPYPHDDYDKGTFSKLGRSSVVPDLPYYMLPDFWSQYGDAAAPETGGSFIGNMVSGALKSIKNKITNAITGQSDSDISTNKLNTNEYVSNPEVRSGYKNNHVFVDYSTFCPVISYDLNWGSPKTESHQLYNGSSFESLTGFNYNITLNLSILDDVFGSMRKYMNQYYNCVYDLEHNAIAPYYAMAFDIRLYIFRSGKQVKDYYKFIGIPTDYTPRLSGMEQPNETRVDLTFSVIGMDYYNMYFSPVSPYTTYVLPEGSEVTPDSRPGYNSWNSKPNQLKWGQVILNPIGGSEST